MIISANTSAAEKAISATASFAVAHFPASQSILELVGQFAQFPMATGGRVALQRVNGSPDAAHDLYLSRRFSSFNASR